MKTIATTETKLYTITDAALKLGLQPNQLWYRVYLAKTFPEPTITVGRRTYYDERTFLQLTQEQ